jgi:2-methylisocitrate lyase-like PEP mutase family enzyme
MTLHESNDPINESTSTDPSTPTDARPRSARERFRDLHVPGRPLLMPNPWDAGSAKILERLGFQALATTSGGFAGTVGRLDGRITRDEALRHAEQVAAAVSVPVSADLESCFAPDASGVAETVRLAAGTGLAGCSIEDYDPATGSMFPIEVAAERVAAAAEAAHAGPDPLVLTARADGALHGVDDLDDTIARLRAFEAAGADVLYAPAVSGVAELERLLAAVSIPVNVLALPDAPEVSELAKLGVARVSVGSGFFRSAMGALVVAGRGLLDEGSYGFWGLAGRDGDVIHEAFA